MGDLNKRRGRVMGMNPDPDNRGWQIVEAEVPMGEMSSYAIDLRSMSQGRGSYSLKFVRYEEVPQINQAKIIEVADESEQTVAMAMFSGIFNLGIGTGSFIGGSVCTHLGLQYVGFFGCAIAMVALAYCVFVLVPRMRRRRVY